MGNLSGMIDIEAYAKQALEKIKREGRYRIFAELERNRGNFPKAKMYMDDKKKEVRYGARMIIWEWVNTPKSSRQCIKR